MKKNKKQKTITKNELLMIEGLLAMRLKVREQFKWIERTIADIVKEEPEDYSDYFGLVSDYMWEDGGAKQLLKNLEIKVIKVIKKDKVAKVKKVKKKK